jgi:hypothetical protein
MRDTEVLNSHQIRLTVRQHARRLMRDSSNSSVHLARLRAAMELPGSEPVQGALADIFVAFGSSDAPLKRMALQLASDRLANHVLRWFDTQVDQRPLPRITPLATRWSILARPTTNISTRARRCSVDDSRALATQVVQAHIDADMPAQQEFFHHCITCHDNLAFMLARRALLHQHASLPPEWKAVSSQLEQPRGLV